MKFSQAIDLYIADMRREGRINSPNTERGYRDTLAAHAADVDERDPRQTTRDDVKRTLNRWPNANTRRKNRSILASFYDWTMQELTPGRVGNPVHQTRAPRTVKPQVYRMTRAEVVACLGAAHTRRERRVAFLGICAGIRNHELRHLQRRHFERPGWIHISGDIAKGGRERWVPVLPELERVAVEILIDLGPTTWDRASKQWIGSTWCPPSAGATRAATPSVWTSSSSPHPARCSARS
jgi:integrase